MQFSFRGANAPLNVNFHFSCQKKRPPWRKKMAPLKKKKAPLKWRTARKFTMAHPKCYAGRRVLCNTYRAAITSKIFRYDGWSDFRGNASFLEETNLKSGGDQSLIWRRPKTLSKLVYKTFMTIGFPCLVVRRPTSVTSWLISSTCRFRLAIIVL